MNNADDIKLTDDEIKKVNEIITGIQSDLKQAIEAINSNDFDKALKFINNGMSRTSCPICHKKMTLLKADVVHTKTVCPVDADLCIAEKEAVTDTAIGIKDEFVPMATEKKAIKDKKKELKSHDNLPLRFPSPSSAPVICIDVNSSSFTVADLFCI